MLYTFYPPLIGSPFYYIGIVLVVVGSWIWVALMSVNLHAWKRDNPGAPVPLAMFANVAGSYLWAWTAVGAALELLFQILPVALGLRTRSMPDWRASSSPGRCTPSSISG